MHGLHVRIQLQQQRYRCKACEASSLEPLPWIHQDRQATQRLVDAIERDCLIMLNMQTAHKYGVDDRTIRSIQDGLIQRLERESVFETPKWLGIDELYITSKPRAVFTNIGERALIEMLDNRKKITITAFLETLDTHKVQVVTMDMWRPYRDAVREVMPHATVTVDKWHVVRLANKALENVRKAYHPGLNAAQRSRLLGNRFTLLKRRKDLTEPELANIETWRKDFPELIAAYELKERFYGVYGASTALEAQRRYARWLASIPEPLKARGGPWHELITAMDNWGPEIMSYFEHRVTNAYTESMNRVIRNIDRGGNGYSFRILRARAIFRPNFWKTDKLASQAKSARGAFTDNIPTFTWRVQDLNLRDEVAAREVVYGADLEQLANYLKEVAGICRLDRWMQRGLQHNSPETPFILPGALEALRAS